MSQALNRANISADLLNKYNVVFIGSKVRKQGGQGGRSYYQHPLDPLLKPRESVLLMMMMSFICSCRNKIYYWYSIQ